MFRKRLHGAFLAWYLNSPHKVRIDLAGKTLLAKCYRGPVIQQYLNEWIRFTHWFAERNRLLPSHLTSQEAEQYLKDRLARVGASRRRSILAADRIFLEVDECGYFPRRVTRSAPDQSELYQQLAPPHIEYLHHHRNLSVGTLRHRRFCLAKFFAFLRKSGVGNVETLTPRHIHDSFLSLGEWAPATRLGYATTLRGFLRWGFAEGILPADLSPAVYSARQYRDATLPNVLTDNEVEKLLCSMERRSPLGRRDFAIVLLAARYGLRPSDIRQLSLENIHWRDGVISLTQTKTARLLQLPLLKDVAEALIDYLKNGRPETSSRQVFVRHLAPFEPFAGTSNLPDIMRRALSQAGMLNRPGLRGLYLFRHSLATRLLRNGNAITTISSVLGHQDVSSTLIYAKVNLAQLQTVAISIAEVQS
jgi:site-specific recombinase XerD